MTADELACKLDRIQLVVDMIVDRLAKVEQRLDGVSPTVALQERIERKRACTTGFHAGIGGHRYVRTTQDARYAHGVDDAEQAQAMIRDRWLTLQEINVFTVE